MTLIWTADFKRKPMPPAFDPDRHKATRTHRFTPGVPSQDVSRFKAVDPSTAPLGSEPFLCRVVDWYGARRWPGRVLFGLGVVFYLGALVAAAIGWRIH
jgi:hypothetical protein